MKGLGRVCVWSCAVILCLSCCGCATLLGGIIGYQSGELAAGIAIGAAVDYGGDVADGISYLLTDKETRFEQKVSLDSEQGTIKFAKSDFSASRLDKMMCELGKKFEENSWSYSLCEKKKRAGEILFLEKWLCNDGCGNEFHLCLSQQKRKDGQVLVEQANEGEFDRSAVTVQIHDWLKEAALL